MLTATSKNITEQDEDDIVYPDSDGKPMADNTKQFNWIVLIKEGLEAHFAPDPAVFVAGDLLWYPVKGDPKLRVAPDVLVAFGRPKGDRGSYQQWKEADIAPQVVFEVLSPGNSPVEMSRKFNFYERYGVEEYYLYDPDANELLGWHRKNGSLAEIDTMQDWCSPRLQIRFVVDSNTLFIYYPDGKRFATYTEIVYQIAHAEQIIAEKQKKIEETDKKIKKERQKAEEERQKAEEERRQKEILAQKLKELGINPADLLK
jgi:Uma2 family endonuclease